MSPKPLSWHLDPGIWLIVSGTILFSSKAIVVKHLYSLGIAPLELQALRMIFVFPFYAAVLVYSLWLSGWGNLSRKELLYCFVAGIACYHAASYLDLLGLQYISAGLERIILFCYPAIAVLFSYLFLKEKPSSRLWVALLLSYTGIILFFYGDLTFGSQNLLLGGCLVFLASIFTAWFMVANQRFSRQIGSQRFISLAMLAACVTLLTHAYVADVGDLTAFSQEQYAWAMTMAVLMTVVPSFLISAGIKRIGASKAGVVGTVGPLFTILLSNQLLGEPISALHLAGVVFVLLGMRQLRH